MPFFVSRFKAKSSSTRGVHQLSLLTPSPVHEQPGRLRSAGLTPGKGKSKYSQHRATVRHNCLIRYRFKSSAEVIDQISPYVLAFSVAAEALHCLVDTGEIL